MKRNLRLVALLLVLVMALGTVVACKKTEAPAEEDSTDKGYTGGDTLVVGYDLFSEKFSPFFATTAYDQDAAGITQVGLLSSDREGNIVLKGIEGETRAYNGTDYTYTGIADCTITKNADGTITYAFKLREDVKFSDGKNLTADDVIFSMYVLSDPTYDGSSTFYAQPIVGMEEYRADRSELYKVLLKDGPNATNSAYTAEQSAYFFEAFEKAADGKATKIIIPSEIQSLAGLAASLKAITDDDKKA